MSYFTSFLIVSFACVSYANPLRRETCGPDGKTIADLAMATDDLSTLVTAVQLIDAVAMLSGFKDYTVFAPNNDAFMGVEGLDEILEDKGLVAKILQYHIVEGEFSSDELKDGPVATVLGQDVEISFKDGKVMVNDAEVLMADIAACNGVVHVIDSVLMPSMNMMDGDMMDGDMMDGDMMDGDMMDDDMMDDDMMDDDMMDDDMMDDDMMDDDMMKDDGDMM
eukprot:Awhi_evm1s8524